VPHFLSSLFCVTHWHVHIYQNDFQLLGGWEKLQLEEIRHGYQLEDHWDYLIAGHDFWSPEKPTPLTGTIYQPEPVLCPESDNLPRNRDGLYAANNY